MSESGIPPLLLKLIERLEGEETLELEYKAAQGGIPNSIWETVSAFANTNGGWIILGVAEDDRRSPVIKGVGDAGSQLKVFCDSFRNPQRISYPACGASDTAIETIDGKDLIVIRVRAAPLRDRPVYIRGNPYAGTYVRRHSGDYLATKQEVDRMMREASTAAADSAVLSKFDLADLDPDDLGRYRRLYQNANPGHPWNAYDDRRFLEAIGGYRRDREAGIEGLTVAGLLMLGKPEAIREWRTRHLIDYRLLPVEADLNTRWDDRIAWEGNLLSGFETIYPRLTGDLPRPFRLEGGRRVEDSPVHIALREALVNLLAHADYADAQASLITRSSRGYYFRNPGSSRVSETDLLTSDRSDPRNPALVRMFRLIDLAEEAGTGLPKIRQAWRELGYRLPDIHVDSERYEFVLNLHHIHLLSDDDRSWLDGFGEPWTEAEQLALVVARHDGEVDNVKVRSMTGRHSADITKVLGGLRDRGFLQMIGGGRGARYELGPTAQTAPAGVSGAMVGGLEPSGERSESLPPRSEGLGPSSEGLPPRSEGLGPSSEGLLPRSEGLGPSSAALWEELRGLAKVARERPHLDAPTRDNLLVALCARSPLSLRQLSDLMDRTEPHLRESVRSLMAAGRLMYLYPERAHHPNQKYVATRHEMRQ